MSELAEPRFWELHAEDGNVFYVDPERIIAVWVDKDKQVNVDLGDDDHYIPSKADGERLMAWAKHNSQSIPEVNGNRPLFGSN